MAKTDILLFSDDDDIWSPLKAEKILAVFSKGYLCACHNFSCFGSKNTTRCSTLGKLSKPLPRRMLLLGDNIYGGGSTISSKKSLVSAIPFNENLASCEDLDWWRRVQLSGCSIYYCGEDLVAYRRHTSNMGKNRLLMSSTLFSVAIDSIRIGLLSTIGGCVMILKALIRLVR